LCALSSKGGWGAVGELSDILQWYRGVSIQVIRAPLTGFSVASPTSLPRGAYPGYFGGRGGNNLFMSAVRKGPLLIAAEQLERWGALDRAIEFIQPIVRERIANGPAGDVLRGRWLGHALHPLLTDVPIGAWTSSLILDLAGGSSSEGAADLLVAVGVAAVAPTALSGWSDWGETKTIEQRRVGIVHAATNIAATTMFASSLRMRREGRRGPGKLLSLAAAGMLGVGGYLGGHLSYAQGAGVGER
jgi:uncharacterized membrane protein